MYLTHKFFQLSWICCGLHRYYFISVCYSRVLYCASKVIIFCVNKVVTFCVKSCYRDILRQKLLNFVAQYVPKTWLTTTDNWLRLKPEWALEDNLSGSTSKVLCYHCCTLACLLRLNKAGGPCANFPSSHTFNLPANKKINNKLANIVSLHARKQWKLTNTLPEWANSWLTLIL